MSENKEKIYDEEISPLMNKIIEICNDKEIPFFATFEFNDGEFCTSASRKNGHIILNHYEALRQCIQDNRVNVDKYIFWLKQIASETGHSSVHLKLLGVNENPIEEI